MNRLVQCFVPYYTDYRVLAEKKPIDRFNGGHTKIKNVIINFGFKEHLLLD